MKILFWLSIGLDRRTPSEHLLTAIVEALYRQGHTVHILQKDTDGEKAKLTPRMTELGVTTSTVKSYPPKKNNFIARFSADVLYVRNCKKWLKKNKDFDRVFMQSSNVAGFQTSALKKYFKSIPVTFNVQDIFPENAAYCGSISRDGIIYKVLSAMQKKAYSRVDKIVTISEDMKSQLSELGVPAEKIEVIYNWSYRDTPYDLSALDYTRVAPLFDKDKFNVVYAGNIGMMQNVELVVRTAAKMKEQSNVAFHIFGDGLYKNKLVALAEELGADNLTFHPMLDSADAPALYASADLNVIPLAENIYRTALPSKTATCLACGKHIAFCIGKDSEFGQKMSRDFGVALLEPNDTDALAAEIMSATQSKGAKLRTDRFETDFSLSGNSQRYAETIVK